MCPAHVEHFLDTNFLRSLSATERWSLWQQHARQPLNEYVVKLDFLRKGGVEFPPFRRRKWRPATVEKTKIPAAVKAHYRKRVHPFSDLETVVQLEHLTTAAAGTNANGSDGVSISTQIFRDQQEFLTSLRLLQVQILMEICPKSLRNNKRAASEEKSLQGNSTDSRKPPVKRSRRTSEGNHFKNEIENHKMPLKKDSMKLKPLAFLKPISWDDSELILITKRTTKVGSAPACDIVLAGDCAAISGHHLTLIFDRLEQRFELLNYSPFGMEIDGVRYSMGQPSNSLDHHHHQGGSVDSKIRSFLSQGKPQLETTTKLTPSWPCAQCAQSNAKSAALAGFDGPAQLRNGSVIRVGCVKLLFVIPSSH